MEPTDKNKPKDDIDAASDPATAKAGTDPVAELGGSEQPGSDKDARAAKLAGASASSDKGSAADSPVKSTDSAAATKDAGSGTSRTTATDPKDASASKAGTGTGTGTAAGAGSGGTKPPSRPAKSSSSGGRGLASLALLIALAAGGLSLWQWYKGQAAEDGPDVALQERLEQLEQDQRQASETQAQRLESLPRAEQLEETRRLVNDLQRSQQQLRNRLEEQGDNRTDWKLAEAEYLLRLASLRLMAAQDIRSASEMLEAVDQIMRDQPDSGVFPVREALARVQSELNALPNIDRAGIYLRLAALNDRVDRLVALPVPEFEPGSAGAEDEAAPDSTWAERVLARLERYVRVDFKRGEIITPLMGEAEMQRIHRTLQLTIEQAQWAALRGEQEVYRSSLERANEVLERFFERDNQQAQAMREQLSALAERQVSATPPDLAPVQRALNDYMQDRGQSSGGDGQDQEAANE